MTRIYKLITSRETMGVLFMVLAAVLAVATFIENDFGYQASRALVYNTWWFELIFFLLALNMFGHIMKFKMWHRHHLPVFLFHFSFFLIIIGAAVTRYIGYEGNMPIREGETTNLFYSSDAYVSVEAEHKPVLHQKAFLSPATPRQFSQKIVIDGKTYRLESEAFIPNATMRPVPTPGGKPLLGLLVSGAGAREEFFLAPGEILRSGNQRIGFEPSDTSSLDISIRRTNENRLLISGRQAISILSMQGNDERIITAGESAEMASGQAYKTDDLRMALSRFWPEAEYRPVTMPAAARSTSFPDAVAFRLSGNDQEKSLYAFGRTGQVGQPATAQIGNATLSIRFGSLPLKLPFSLRLNHFELERYPGSQSPASYASEVTLSDPAKDTQMNYRIFMNNILDYRGFRFYQSSYDSDEKGTILSVNHDFWGTIITYLGYFLMALGMFWALVAPGTRFRHLLNKTNQIYKQRKSLAIIGLFILPAMGWSQTMPPKPDQEIARELGRLWVQDNGGRIKPLNTMHQEVMIKLVKHNSFHGFNPDQMLLGILTHPAAWQETPLITVKHPELKRALGITGPKAAFSNFFDPQQNYRIHKWVEAAYRKKPAERDQLEQEIIKVDEQVNVFYLAQSGNLYKLFPINNELSRPWLTPSQAPDNLSPGDSLFVASALPALIVAAREGNQQRALQVIKDLKTYQEDHGKTLLPSEGILNAELLYNRLNIFLWLATLFFTLGILLVLYNIAGLVFPALLHKWVLRIAAWLVTGGFVYHTFGLALRWYISGHAPWSNGYESMLFIGWAILLAGLIFSRHSPLVMAVSALFAGVVLMVSHLSWMNPEITHLVPVLKSYWLTLHVAVIIGGYGFLTLGALLGFLNLLLTGIQNRTNWKRIRLTIEELTAINEMSLTVGLYLMTIGSFLGGVWANESWGRYWGWDPKETWSLITVLIYAFVIHIRFIPGLRGKLAFNTAALISFSSVIMTYLGVNYYLSGMHSYAAGDPVPVPSAIYYALTGVAVVIGYAYWKEGMMNREKEV
jgi:cytochrome c-type biogenesis protein CcsB